MVFEQYIVLSYNNLLNTDIPAELSQIDSAEISSAISVLARYASSYTLI